MRARGCLLYCTLYVVKAARRELLLTILCDSVLSIHVLDHTRRRSVHELPRTTSRARASAAPRACVTACFFDACFFVLCVSQGQSRAK